MQKNITLGQYFPGNSLLHRLDPRTKILLLLMFVVAIFAVSSYIALIAIAAVLAAGVLISRVGIKTVLNSIRPLLFILVFTFAINIFFYTGKTVLWEYGILHITVEGIIKAIYIAVRLLLLITVTSLLMLTTSPMQLTDALESMGAPLKKIHFPVHELSMMMSIAMRFIPTLIDETDKIMKSQTARGAEFDSGNLLKKAKNMIPLLVPLFVSSFKRADELALAMEARCYRGDIGRTKLKTLKMTGTDKILLFVCLVFCVALIAFLRN